MKAVTEFPAVYVVPAFRPFFHVPSPFILFMQSNFSIQSYALAAAIHIDLCERGRVCREKPLLLEESQTTERGEGGQSSCNSMKILSVWLVPSLSPSSSVFTRAAAP